MTIAPFKATVGDYIETSLDRLFKTLQRNTIELPGVLNVIVLDVLDVEVMLDNVAILEALLPLIL